MQPSHEELQKKTERHLGRPLVSIVVPAYNEADILEESLTALSEYMKTLESEYNWELLIIDDGSIDSTGEKADAFASKRNHVRVFHHHCNFRLGQALRTGFNNSRGEIVVVMDLDLSYAPEHIGRMLARMKETRAKIVIASPYMKGGHTSHIPFMRRLFSIWANRLLSFMATKDFFSDKLTNITGMVRAYDGRFIRRLKLLAMDVDVNPEIIQKAKFLRARIVEIPAHLDWGVNRKKSTSLKQKRSSMRVMRSIIQNLVSAYMFRPFLLFILPGLSLFILSLYPLVWTMIHTVHEFNKLASSGLSLDYKFSEAVGKAFSVSPHAFIIGGIALVVAIQLISLGLLALQKKRYFMEIFYITSMMEWNSKKNGRKDLDPTLPLR